MEFSEFAGLLYPIIGGGDTTGRFTRKLFEKITDIPVSKVDDNPLIDQSDETFKSYFNGTRAIRLLAKKINPYIDVTIFEAFIYSFDEGVLFNLCSAFAKECPGATTKDIGERLSELFQSILLSAVGSKKGIRTKSPGDTFKDKYGISLVIEANGVCPNDWCSNELEADIDGRTQLCYEALKIDESGPDTYENYIAVCPTCYQKIKASRDPSTTARLKELKRNMLFNEKGSNALSSEQLEQDIEHVLEKISITPPEELTPLNYDPVPVRQKISKDNNTLYMKIRYCVAAYFIKVDEWLKQMDQEGKQKFQPFCNAMEINYMKLSMQNLPQPVIFDKLAEWLQTNTNRGRDACEIVVAYFVQKCEVFDAITQ